MAFVFGSVAKGTENLGSDIDVLIIGDIDFTEVVTVLYSAQSSLGREINPKTPVRSFFKCLKLLKKHAGETNMLNFLWFLKQKDFQYDTGTPAGRYFLRNR